MIIIINGSLGVGKSAVANELVHKFEQAVHLSGDHIGDVHPFDLYDPARISHLYHTLALLVGFHQQHGYQNFVINYVFESAASLAELHTLLRPLEPAIYTYWLTCDPEVQGARIRARGRAQLEWELTRYLALRKIQAKAAADGFIGLEVDTTRLSAAETASAIWTDILAE